MEEEKNNTNEDFKDFDDDETQIPELEQDLVAQEQKELEDDFSNKEEINQQTTPEITQAQPEISDWEEIKEDNSVVKKYIIYISKDFIPYIDNLSVDARSAYINDAIQKKIDGEDIKKQKNKKTQLIIHLALIIITFCAMTPIALLMVNKAILLTFENYKYSQENFEKLYKQRFENNKAYMRSIEYNKEHKIK